MEVVADDSSLENLLSSIDVSADTFLQPSHTLQAASLVAAKRILDPVVADYSVFKEVALKGLDVEQVWEQIRMVGDQVRKELYKQGDLKKTAQTVGVNGKEELGSHEDSLMEESDDEEEEQTDQEIMDDDEEQEELDEDEDMLDEEEEIEGDNESEENDEFPTNPEFDEESDEDTEVVAEQKQPTFKKDIHGLNDEFFSIDDFNRLTEQQEISRSDNEEDDDIDYFAGIPYPI